MRRTRRGGHSGHEFGGSGEDSFVAVVVTKLTGALLFILLLTMVIMALIPKAVDLAPKADSRGDPPPVLAITTPETLPEAIAGRPYVLALAATGGRGPLRWGVVGDLPDGLTLDSTTGRIAGVPKVGTPRPLALVVQVNDEESRAEAATKLVVYQSDRPLTIPSRWKPNLPPIPWRQWMERGFGFLVLVLVHLVGMNALRGLERWSLAKAESESEDAPRGVAFRFAAYRAGIRLASLAAIGGLAIWLWWPRG
jgi:Putative Ig domain